MTGIEFHRRSAAGLLHGFRSGALTPAEMVEDVLATCRIVDRGL